MASVASVAEAPNLVLVRATNPVCVDELSLISRTQSMEEVVEEGECPVPSPLPAPPHLLPPQRATGGATASPSSPATR